MVDKDYSFKILEEIFKIKEYKTKDEVMQVAKKMTDLALSRDDLSGELKNAYKLAYQRLDMLSFKEMMELFEIMKLYSR
jgi:hypothetical protein